MFQLYKLTCFWLVPKGTGEKLISVLGASLSEVNHKNECFVTHCVARSVDEFFLSSKKKGLWDHRKIIVGEYRSGLGKITPEVLQQTRKQYPHGKHMCMRMSIHRGFLYFKAVKGPNSKLRVFPRNSPTNIFWQTVLSTWGDKTGR